MANSKINNLTISDQTISIINQLTEYMPFGFIIYKADKSKEIIFSNNKAASLFGCSSVEEFLEFTNHSFSSIANDEENTLIRDNSNTYVNRYRIKRKDGSEGFISDIGYPAESTNNGKVFCACISDVSQDDQTKAIVSSLAADYEVLFHIDYVTGKTDFILSGKWIKQDVLANFIDLPYDMKVRYFAEKYVVPEDRVFFIRAVEYKNAVKVIGGGKPIVSRFRMNINNDEQWYELKGVHHADHTEGKCAVVGIRNVNEEMQIQEHAKKKALRDHNHLLSLHDIIHSGMWNITIDEDSNILDVKWSDEYRHLLGYTDEKDFPNELSSWSDKLHPEDKERAIELFWKGSKIRTQETSFDTDFRLLNKNGTYNWYHVAGRVEPNDDGTYLYFGVFIDSTAEHKNAEYQELQKQNHQVIEILASEYSSVYYIDLTTDALNPYTMNEETETTFGSVFRSGITYSEAYQLYVDKLILPEDKEMMLKAGSVENIKKQLANKKTFITQYRSSDNHYNEMKFVKVGGDNDTPVAVALGFADKDEEIREMIAIEQERQRNTDIIEILASEYSSVYYIDLTTDALNPYTMNEETETTFGSVFRSGITYSEAYQLYVDKLIHPEDKKMMLKAGSSENIRKQLANKKTFITQYRSSDNHYNEMKFVKVGGDNDTPVSVALGFADKDDEIRQKMAEEQEKQRNTDIIEILASEYSSVYYIDLTTDELNPYTMNEETETTFGSVFRSGITYSDAFKLYVDKLILPEDKKMMLKEGSIQNIRKQLANKKTFITQYRSSDNHYNEMKFVKVGGDNDAPVSVALGFADKDEEIRQRMAEEQEKQRNFDIIEILASEYSSVYYIDLTTDELDPYTMNADTESAFGKIFRSGIKYSAAYRMYVDQLILPADKAMMLKAGSVGNIMKELRTKKTFLTTYRNSEGHYSEMKFVKVGNEEGLPTAVALGFADKDEELRAREEEQQKLQRNIDIIEILASEYSSVYYIDLTTDELDPYTMNEETESEFGNVFRSGIHYSDAFRLYVDTLVDEKDKKNMLNAGSVYNILKELTTKKTFITTYKNSEGHYCEMKFVKVGNAENPQAVALGFADKDEEIRNEIRRKEISERDAAVIQGLADDFGCIVYASYDDYDEVQYRIDPLFEKNIPGWTKIKKFDERLKKLTDTIMHPDDRAAFMEATRPDVVHDAVDKDNVYFVNFRTLINGEITYYQCKFAKDEQHKDTHVIAGFHNVDAETKREMDALDRATMASRAKTDFLFNMSHDIRTPMNAIIGFTNIAMKEIDNREKALENLAKVKTSSDMLLSLINDILDMSRIESGKVTLNTEKLSVADTFSKIEPVMSSLAKQKNIDLSFDICNINDNYVFADVPRMERILVNLISNAVKYTSNYGRVRVCLEQTGTNDNKGIYRFTIEDNGFGMSDEFQKHMFEEFAREETSTNSGIQGTGLGLSLAQKLVVLMNGDIQCRSKLGVGTTFTITIPLELQSVEQITGETADITEEKLESLKGKLILLVDDNELNREIATYNLEEEGIKVETAADGKEAFEKVFEKGPSYYDFILMDIQMPVMNGYESTIKIRRALPNLTAPIIALSANAFEEDRQKSMEVGMDEHIAKPINMVQLNKTLAKFLKKQD